MDRRTVLEELATMAVTAGLAGCTGSSPDGKAETTPAATADTRMETTGGARLTTTSEESATATSTGTASPPDIPRPGTPPMPTGTPGNRSSCSLSHEIVASGEELTPVDTAPTLRYANLSPEAQRVVRRVVESGDGVSIPSDSPDRPSEFTYSDEVHSYDIAYRGTTYRLFTYTSAGCPIFTPSE